MLRERDEDIWELPAEGFQFRLLNHWIADADTMWSRQLVTLVKEKNGLLSMRGSANLPRDELLLDPVLRAWCLVISKSQHVSVPDWHAIDMSQTLG